MSTKRSLSMVGAFVGMFVGTNIADALVTIEDIRPGEIRLGFVQWNQREQFSELLKSQPAVHGTETWASWGGSSMRIEYLYQGNGGQLQQMIDRLDKIDYSRSLVRFTEHEGYDDGSFHRPRKMPLPYDWTLTFTERDLYRKARDQIENQPDVVLTIYLGDRIDRQKLRLPERLLKHPMISSEVRVQTGRPANALHAIARARRND